MEYIQIGYLLKPSGIDGYIKVNIEDDFMDDFLDAAHAFSMIRGDYVPFLIENVEDSHHLLVKFEDFNSPEEASKLSNSTLYLTSDQLQHSSGILQSKIHHWIGYEIISKNEDLMISLGVIDEIIKLPTQQNAVLVYNGKSVQIPMVEDFIFNIDDEQEQIFMILPEGLLDV